MKRELENSRNPDEFTETEEDLKPFQKFKAYLHFIFESLFSEIADH